MADLATNFAGIRCPNPFWLASGPAANCGEQVMPPDPHTQREERRGYVAFQMPEQFAVTNVFNGVGLEGH